MDSLNSLSGYSPQFQSETIESKHKSKFVNVVKIAAVAAALAAVGTFFAALGGGNPLIAFGAAVVVGAGVFFVVTVAGCIFASIKNKKSNHPNPHQKPLNSNPLPSKLEAQIKRVELEAKEDQLFQQVAEELKISIQRVEPEINAIKQAELKKINEAINAKTVQYEKGDQWHKLKDKSPEKAREFLINHTDEDPEKINELNAAQLALANFMLIESQLLQLRAKQAEIADEIPASYVTQLTQIFTKAVASVSNEYEKIAILAPYRQKYHNVIISLKL